MFVVQLTVQSGHFTSAGKVGDDTRRVKYLRLDALGNVSQRASPPKLISKVRNAKECSVCFVYLGNGYSCDENIGFE